VKGGRRVSLDAKVKESPEVTGLEPLAGWFSERERPRADWKVGLEHEKIAIRAGTLDPVPYEGPNGIAAALRAFTPYGYEPYLEEGRVIATQRTGLTVSLEPGGQIELSGRPFPDIHCVARELDRHLEKCRTIGAALGLELLATGYRPWGRPADMPWMPKSRYTVMRPFLEARGRLAPDMMSMTGSTQASFDFSSERDMAEKLRVALAIQPAITALSANSPVVDGRPSGWKCYRVAVWEEVDPARCGLLDFAFEPGFEERAYASYANWALDVPMVFLRRDGGYLPTGGVSFRRFLAEGLHGHRPSLLDWEDHLSTLFPEVRVKGVVEVRGADACDMELTRAVLALWKGLLYDQQARDWVWDAVKRFSVPERRALMIGAGREALQARTPDGRTLAQLAGTLLDAAEAGLCRQNACGDAGEDERKFLAPLRARVESGRAPADDALEVFLKGGDTALAAHLRCA
jgi:glutamate--cysteine ligase